MGNKGGEGVKKKKAAAAAAVTVAAAAGMVTGTVFESPAELLPEVVQEMQQAEEDAASVAEERQKGPVDKLRSWVLGLPAAVRMLVAVPLWCIGWVLLSALSVFWTGAAPLLTQVLNWICLAVVLLVVFTLAVKAAFPAASVRRILRPRNVILLVGLSAVFCAADLALPTMWKGYDVISRTVWRVGAACLLAFVCGMELRWQGKRAVKKQTVGSVPKRTAVEEEARRLADTVCGKY